MRPIEFQKGHIAYVRRPNGDLFEVGILSVTDPDGPDTTITVQGYGKKFHPLQRPAEDQFADRYFIALRGEGTFDQLVPALPEIVDQWKIQKAKELVAKLTTSLEGIKRFNYRHAHLNDPSLFPSYFRITLQELLELSAPAEMTENA